MEVSGKPHGNWESDIELLWKIFNKSYPETPIDTLDTIATFYAKHILNCF